MKRPDRLEWIALILTLRVAATIAALVYFAPLVAGLLFLGLLVVLAVWKNDTLGRWDRLWLVVRNLLSGW